MSRRIYSPAAAFLAGSLLTLAAQVCGAVWAAWYGERKLRLL